ncbi:hypothetical protein GGP62_003118 [Salinibacter ruber]|uniref:GmrSD restriction endonuclease domain-containing protein n=1 Tax=Salinibacter ruber TaxID=146919 RepID=UPI00216A9909|nr:DUF262 domain-containing protein [Salinibacter ruber]MCS3708107.1 hypothetical protein [Salinibacter ruber]MCS3854721.1 hypothetical protein [Salinibacter ruber]
MPSFNPKPEYITTGRSIRLEDFNRYSDEFVTRPPYQRKNVWSRKKQRALLDSIFRGYYIPRIVIREVRLGENEIVKEVIDGQQRIRTAQYFLSGKLSLPDSLGDIRPDLPGSTYEDLPSEVRRFVDDSTYDADIVKQIGDPQNRHHQQIATEIFWRLQQGESLNYMEVAHARLSSTARNFVVKYADDQTFDYGKYQPVAENPSKHPFFSIIRRKNNRMQHMALLTRFLILEEEGGPADIKQNDVQSYIDRYQTEDGIGSHEFEDTKAAQKALRNMQAFYRAFEEDPLRSEGDGVPILKVEYFIVSLYLLLRHLREHYVFGETERLLFQDFAYEFHDRWRNGKEEDTDMQIFQNSRQQSAAEIATRQRIMRQHFFEYAGQEGHQMVTKDNKRHFNEAERIHIYRRDEGFCQRCLEEGKPPEEAEVPWEEFEADHVVPHSKGGETISENAQVLCRYHNRQKGGRLGERVGGGASTETQGDGAHPQDERSESLSRRHWLTPVGERGDVSPQEVVERTVAGGTFGFSTDAIKQMRPRPGDRVAFYGSQTGIIADATIASRPESAESPSEALQIPGAEDYPYLVQLEDPRVYDDPVELTKPVRHRLDAFDERSADEDWGWFVLTVRELNQEDFEMLTR